VAGVERIPAVLIVDDDCGTVECFQDMLRYDGYDVSAAHTGADGLMHARRDSFDLVLSDLMLPDISGIELLRELRVHRILVPFVVVTAFGSVATAVEAIKLGASDYVEKPLTGAELRTVVRRSIQLTIVTPAERPLDREQEAAADPRAAKAVEIIGQRYREADLSLRTVAREVGVSTEYLCRLLKRHTGSGFVAHLHRRRVLEAQRLLRDTALSVKEIAFHIGFERTSHFDLRFRNLCGESPTAYRGHHRRGEPRRHATVDDE
jgi:YesN/AraC family two-component response regulator